MRGTIAMLTRRDMRARYFGSMLGVFWCFAQPAVTIGLFWFVFEVGMKAQQAQGHPFSLWITCGMLPWFFFNDTLLASTTAITESPYLVKKVVFRVSVLPVVKLMSALAVHLGLLALMLAMFWAQGHPPRWQNLQAFYYLGGLMLLSLGLGWAASALTVFLRDVGQALAVGLQILFWTTPILWDLERLPEGLRNLLAHNPLNYVVDGYRQAFIQGQWFWERPAAALEFWLVCGAVFCIGAVVFERLRPHFADVL